MLEQVFQDFQLLGVHGNSLPSYASCVALKVDPCLSIGEDPGRLELFKNSFDTDLQEGQGEGFFQVAICQLSKGRQLIVLVMEGRQHEDRD